VCPKRSLPTQVQLIDTMKLALGAFYDNHQSFTDTSAARMPILCVGIRREGRSRVAQYNDPQSLGAQVAGGVDMRVLGAFEKDYEDFAETHLQKKFFESGDGTQLHWRLVVVYPDTSMAGDEDEIAFDIVLVLDHALYDGSHCIATVRG
jgi:hypothetical protein